ncbi:hypothetical protein [uncultured Bacteroides sp.]|uniref:tetratricopeptide repeat protein n=1 Tax=uncultured Bacteroides sp. TaxID=162156 RepID=UPI002AA7DBA7|nr:hypothetical protein [uncultured Bacteroides sp.]
MRKLYIGLLFICGLLASCTDEKRSGIFERVEGYMETYPDSALLLLNQISYPEELRGKQRADYALLLTQARDKNYLDSLQSDSLINIAADYYRESDDKVKTGKALFYYGKVMALEGNDTVSMRAYLDAQEILKNAKEYKLQGFIHEYIGRLNDDRGIYDVALDNYRRSVFYYQKVGYILGIVYDYRNIARVYDIRQNSDSAIGYAKAGISLLKGDSLSPVFSSLLQFLGRQEKKKGNYYKAIAYFHSAIKHERLPNSIKHYYFSLGDAYMQMGQLVKAEECFEQGVTSKSVYTQSGAYNYLYLLEKKKENYAKALFYKEKSDSLLRICQDENLRNAIQVIQRKYKVDKLKSENTMLVQTKRLQSYLWLSLSSLLLVVSIIFYFWIKKQYRRAYRRHIKSRVERELSVIRENEQIIGQYLCQIEDLERQEKLLRGAAKEQIVKLNQKIQILTNENKTIRDDSCAGGIYLLEQLKQGLLIVENMTSKEKIQIFQYMDLLFGDFVTRLKGEYDLNENNLMLAVLVKLGFSSSELTIVFQCEINSIFKKKQRLKSRFDLGSNDNLDAFLTAYSFHLST